MARPELTPSPGVALERIYDGLPEHYRVADEAQGYPLYRWLAGVAGVLSDVEALRTRIDYVIPGDGGAPGDTSDLVDPVTADAEWLPWMAQLVGVRLDPALTDVQARDAIRYGSAGWRAGTKGAVADAARSELTGTKYVAVYDHSISDVGNGGVWDVLLVTRPTETPNPSAVLAAVIARGAKPAGVVLHHRSFESDWDTVTGENPTWDDYTESWDELQEAGF